MKRVISSIVLLLLLLLFLLLFLFTNGCTNNTLNNTSEDMNINSANKNDNVVFVDSFFIQKMQSFLGTLGYRSSIPQIVGEVQEKINESNILVLHEDEKCPYYYTVFTDGIDTSYVITKKIEKGYWVYGYVYFDKIHCIEEVRERIKIKEPISDSNEYYFVNIISPRLFLDIDDYFIFFSDKKVITDKGVYIVKENEGVYSSFQHANAPLVNALIEILIESN